MTTRRQFLTAMAAATTGASLALNTPVEAGSRRQEYNGKISFHDILRAPDLLTVQTDADPVSLIESSEGTWKCGDITVTTPLDNSSLQISVAAPSTKINRIHARWHLRVESGSLYLGDAWERAYGDLEWRGLEPGRVLPWYFAESDGTVTHCYGVKTAPAAFCFWQIDSQGISLWLDIRSGGSPVQLGDRQLLVAQIVTRRGKSSESTHNALHSFCTQMCPNPRLTATPIFGCNDWYYTYGNNSADQTRRDARTIVSLASGTNVRPFVTIDGGWQSGGGGSGGDWTKGTDNFPDMPGLAADIAKIGGRPGIWFRPLYAVDSTPASMRSAHTGALDPTAPGVLDKVHADTARFVSWGIELIKHDFSTYDIFGRWGFEMGPSPTPDGWQFAEGTSRTSAEIILGLYQTIRNAAGDALINGCNTVSHLSAGIFELIRIGDDNSGHQWARTRKMGLNSLAFRACQHQAFYAVDPDCVGITNQVPWSENKQILDLFARSGAVTSISLSPDAATPEVLSDIYNALQQTVFNRTTGAALDWQGTISPEVWEFGTETREYIWAGTDGYNPFENV